MSLFSTMLVNIAALILLATCIHADTPANCTYEDIRGSWVFELGPVQKEGSQPECTAISQIAVQHKVRVKLDYPDIATDEFGNKGFWTLIYNQGFEVEVGGNKFFGFSEFKNKSVSVCSKVKPGWAHDVLGRDWRCFQGEKQGSPATPKVAVRRISSLRFASQINSETMVARINKAQQSWMATTYPQFDSLSHEELLRMAGGKRSRLSRINSETMVARINKAQQSWTATTYPQFDSLSHEELVRLAGGKRSRLSSRPKPATVTEKQEKLRESFPSSFDWRNVDGQNFVSPVRNQGACGSCYSFASLAMAESRLRILTNNTQQHVFSPQDIVECSPYSQGCDGGFPYLIGGKYAEDFGLVEEKCNPYKGDDGKCSTDKSCARNYMSSYKYVGGYYGGCGELAMMEAIYNRGPVAVGFEVYDDFMQYKSGVYHHVFKTGLLENHPFEPFELTNHAVLVVGWGEVTSPTRDRYWIVKNSWGISWGQDGYFWIRRGTDECGIESLAVEATPIISYS